MSETKRQRECVYCHSELAFTIGTFGVNISVDPANKRIVAEETRHYEQAEIGISHCPFCGRYLRGEDDERKS